MQRMENAIAPLPLSTPAAVSGAARVSPPSAQGLKIAGLTPRTLWVLGAAALALVVIVVAMLTWGRETPYRVLFANVSDKDGGAILAQLSQMNVPYRHADGGSAILVPADKVHDVRLKLASQGLPKGGIVGLELMDQSRFGQTQFQERLTFQRGLEGELTRSIMSLGSVQAARVHLAIPQQHGFFREQQKPSASVLVTLHPGRTLDRGQIAGIIHLVSASVADLNPKAVSVLDQNGNLLSTPPDSEGSRGLDAQQLQYVQQIENSYLKRVIDILEPVVGKGNLRATVTTEVDFTQSESTSEQFRPNQGDSPASVRSVQSSESGGGNAATPPSGVPGVSSNQPPTPATPANGTPGSPAPNGSTTTTATPATGLPSRKDQVTNFEVDKTVRVTRNATGTVRRVNAAVVLNHRSSTDAKGRPTTTPLSAEELEKLTALVQESIGYSKERGDSVKVINAPFHVETPAPVVEPPFWSTPAFTDLVRSVALPLGLAIVALAVVLGVVRPTLKTMRETKEAELAHLEPLNGPMGSRGGQLQATVDDPLAMPLPAPDGGTAVATLPALAPVESKTTAMQLEQARQMARENPVAMANILRGWVQGESA